MKTLNTTHMSYYKSFLLAGLLIVSIFDAKSQDKLSQSLASIKEKTQEVQIDKITYQQSIDILDEAKGKISFVSVLVDDKGKSTKESFEFYISDIDQNTIIRKTSGKKLFISLTTSNNQKFIKHLKDDKLDSYTNNLEILLSSADAAQEMVNLFKSAIPLVKSSEKAWETNTDALNWLKSNIISVNSGSAPIEQSFSFGERKDYLAVFTTKKTDQAGVSTEEKYEFNILDINKKELTVKVSGTQLSVLVENNGNNRYIKYSKNNEQQNFDNAFEILAEDIDQARNIIMAFSTAIEKSKPAMPDFSSLEKSFDFITKNIIDPTLEKKNIIQKIDFGQGNGTRTIFTFSQPDSKGKTIEEQYEFYLNDLEVNSLNFKVSGGKITIVLIPKNNTKFIKYYKDNIQLDFQNEAGILTSDIETTRELIEAFKTAIKNSQTEPAAWKNIDEAIAYLTNTITGETIGSEIYKLNFSSIANDPLNVKYVLDKTDSKGLKVEQSFEFYPYMLDPGTVKIASSGKFLTVSVIGKNKKSYIKVFKEGIQQSFDDGITIMAFDAKQAQDIAEAIKYIINNVKTENMVWNDKESAMKFITENVVDLKSGKIEVKQKIEFTDPCKITFTISSSDDKGKTTDEIYEFALTDINKQIVDYNVSGKNVLITLTCKNKEKLVKAYKNGVQMAWGTSVKIETNDVETAKNIAEAFKTLITLCGN